MKKTKVVFATLLTTTLISALFLSAGCHNKGDESAGGQPAKPAAVSAVKNSFQEVTSQLDGGGNLYGYLSTEQWLTGLSDKISSWREFVKEIPNVKPEDEKNIMRAFDVATSLVKHSGIEEVSGVGMSTIQREAGFYHTKFILHHYKGQGTGYMWSMFGKSPHPLSGLDLLPANSALASFWDFDLPMLWSVLDKEIAQSGIPNAKETMQKIPDAFAGATGLKLDQVLASLGNEYGMVITLNESNKITPPIPGQTMQVPEPGLMLVIKVKDDLIFNRVDELLKDNPMVVKNDKDGVKMRTMPVPLPIQMELRPTIARSGDYLFLASSDKLILEALAVKGGKKPGLKSTEEFKKLAQGMPESGNQFTFVSQTFGQTWQDIQTQMMTKNAGTQPGQAELFKKLMSLNGGVVQSYSVSANGEEGWVGNGNGNQDPSKIVLLPVIAVPAVLAGVTLPALAKAKTKAQNINCINNLKQLQLAKKMWADDKNKKDDDVPTFAELKEYLPTTLKCPSGGTYQLNKNGENPTCSIPGHSLP